MKTHLLILGLTCALAGAVGVAAEPSAAADKTGTRRVGVYDSRLVAFARFWSGPYQDKLKEMMTAARAAQAAGDTQRFQRCAQALRDEQTRLHLEVFSTAPCDEALAALKERLPEIMKQADVTVLVSQWDTPTLQQYPEAVRIDVTDLLVQEFKIPAAQQKILVGLKGKQPLSLEEAHKAIAAGQM
jgi:hypothetical protein